MNIVACVKRVPTTEAVAKPTADGTGLDSTGNQYMISFYDEIAVEEAVKTKEALGAGEVTVLSMGSKGGTKEIRECLAKGGDKAVVLVDEEWESRDARATAKALTAQIQSMGADLVFMGRVATDRDNARSARWSRPTSAGPASPTSSPSSSDGKGTAKVETEAGVETVEFQLPAVITCQKGLNEPRYAGLKGIMAAKKKPLEEVAPEAVREPDDAVEVALPPARKEGRIVGEGADAVPALIDASATKPRSSDHRTRRSKN